MENLLVSVIIPVYNQASFIMKTLYSVFKQTYINWEVWVMDDGSEDNIEVIMGNIRHPAIHYIRLPIHVNANVARNLGIQYARGAYIAMLDADDEWLPEHLEKSLECLKQKEADGIYGSLLLDYPSGEKLVTVRDIRENETTIDYLLGTGYGAQTSTLVMTTESIKNILWDPALNRHQDYDFIVRYTRKYKLKSLMEATVIYHITPKNYSIDYASCMRVIQKYKKEISPVLYNAYHQSMYKVVKNSGVDTQLKDYYLREAVRYKRYLSYCSYLEYMGPTDGKAKFLCMLRYLWGICFAC